MSLTTTSVWAISEDEVVVRVTSLRSLAYSLAVPLVVFGTQAKAVEDCDLLGSLEADPLSVSSPVAFEDIQSTELIRACTTAIEQQSSNTERFHLLRARGYLRSGALAKAVDDITLSHEMGYAAATFALATLHHFGEALPQDFAKAAVLYEQAYNDGVVWAARGLSMIYQDVSFSGYDLEEAKEWLKRFDQP